MTRLGCLVQVFTKVGKMREWGWGSSNVTDILFLCVVIKVLKNLKPISAF